MYDLLPVLANTWVTIYADTHCINTGLKSMGYVVCVLMSAVFYLMKWTSYPSKSYFYFYWLFFTVSYM